MAQFLVALYLRVDGSLSRMLWLRRSVIQNDSDNLRSFLVEAVPLLKQESSLTSGRIVFEIGFALSCVSGWQDCLLDPSEGRCERAVERYVEWCEEARRAILCWIWLAKNLGVAKDIRRMIADLIWEGRSAWSER